MLLISLTLWVSLSGFEVTHLFSNIQLHLLHPGVPPYSVACFESCFFLSQVSCLTWNELKWFRIGSPDKILIVILHIAHFWFPQGEKHKCLDWNKVCNFMGCEKIFVVWSLHVVEAPTSIPTPGRWLYLPFFLRDISTRNHNPAMCLRIVRVMASKKGFLFPFLFMFGFFCVCYILLCLLSWAGDYGKILLVCLFLEQLNWAFVAVLDSLWTLPYCP